ncbi:hypothetical protein Pmani_018933 [Petrolisthes manimaculis]|uniref:Uncharacterized protein n=1 Tax=Petrolisthes manimaculis TaxID=1843537 RepID=A0AAE1PJC6_9EUCA|nr:hypothetical protein Pmani_018933 [Petrolisthes manimaculis]
MNEVISSLEQQLKESQVKQEAAEQESQLLRTQLQESQYLQNFETLDREESSPHQQSSQSISCKISETLQFLEESVMIPSTPGRSSVGGFLDEPLIQSNDLVVFIKQELINLQEALAQEQQNRSKPPHHHVTEYYNQVVAENERDTSVWTLQKAFTEDYILHSWAPHRSSSSHRQSDAFLNIEQDLQRATEDIRTKIRSEYEEKYGQEREALEARLRQDTFVEGDTLYVPRHRSVGPQSLADELHQAGMNTNTTLDDTFETSLLDLNSVPQTWEMQQLKLQVELLMTENKELCSKVEELQKISNLHVEVKTPKEETNQKEQCSNREKQDEQYNVTCQQIEPLSLADELQECSMIITPCQGNSTLLTHTPESLSLKQQLPAVSEENKSLKDNLQQLQEGIECNNAKEEKPAENGVIKQLQSDVEMMRNKNDAQETYVKKLEEELSCKNICEEEVHYLRWNVNTLKEEKSALEEELNLMQKEIDNLVLRENRVQTVTSTGVDKEDKVVQVTQNEGNDTEEQLRETAEELKKNLQTKTEELEDARKLLDSQKKTYDMIVGQINSVRDAFSAIREELGIETSKVEKNEDVVNESQDLSDLVITLSTLEERLQKRNEDLNTMKEQLNEKTLDLNTMKEQLNEKTLDLNTMKEQLDEKTLDLNTMKEQLNEKTLDLNTMKEQLNEKTLDLNTMKEQLNEKTLDLNTMKEQLNEKILDLNTLKEQLNEKTLDLNTMKEQLNDRTVTLQAAYENIDSLKNELYMRTISAENGSDCTEEQKQNQANLDCALERIERLVKEQEEQRLSYENRLAQVVGEKDCELEEIITNFTEKEEAFEEKVKELEDIVKESVNIRESVEEKDKQLQSHLKDISSLQTKIQDLELALSAKCDDYSALKECNSELQSNFSQLQLQHDNDKQNIERTVDMYKEKLDLKIQEFTDLLKVYEEQKKLLHAAESELELLKAKPSKEMETPSNNSILTETHEVSSVLDQSIIDQKLDELESLRNKYAGQIDECSKLRDTVDNLKIMLSKKEEELKQVLLEHKNETESHIEELCKRDEDINDMEIKIATSNEEVTKLKCCVEAKDHKLERLQREMTKVEENLQASNEVKESFEMKLDIEKSSKIQELQTDLEHLNKTYEEVCSDRKNMVIAINEEKEAKEHLEYECQTLKMKLENLEEDYLYIRDELTLKETEITNKSESLSSLEIELQMLQEEMATLSNKKLELIDEQILENKKIEKLIGDIEKYETEMSEKDEQLIKLKHNLSETVTKHSEMEELVKTMQATNSEMASKLKGMEEKESSSISFEEKLMIAEEKLFTMQNDHKEKVAELERCLLDSYSQKENLGIKLAETEEQYKLFSKELEVKIGEIEEKNLILLQLSTENEHLKLELQALGQEISHADVLLKTTETEKINLEEELSLSKTSENNMKEQLEANSCEIDKLVTLVEKYETEMSEKDEQMLCQTKEYEAEIASKEKQVLELNVEIERNNAIITRAKDEFNAQQRNLEEKMKLHINKIEELKKTCSDFENDIARQTTSSTSLKTLMEELASAEDKYAILQADFNTRVKNHTEDNDTYLLEKEQLLSMLKQKEEELNCVCEKNTELDAEMDDMVKHYKNENNVNLEQQQQLACKLTRVEKELSLTKAKLKEAMSCTSAALPLKPEASGELDEQKSLREDIAQLRKELQEKQDALARKEEECKALDDEIEDAVKHYTKENERVWQHCELITTQLTTTQMELSETKTKLLEISQLDKTHVSERVVNSKDIQKDDLIEKEILENENKTIRSQCVALEAAAGRYKEKINEISQTVDTLQTELRVSGKTVNTLMERIGDHEKLRDIYEREKKDKEKQVKELENTITMLKKVAGNEDDSLDKTEELLRRVHHLEEKLEINIQKYNSLAEEHSKYKLEYNRLFKESEQYKALLSKGELMKEDLERKNQDLTTHVNTLTNSFMASETSGKDYPVSARKKKISTLEKEQDSLKLEYAKLVVKLNDTEAVLDSLRRNQGVVSDNESFQRELTWMKEKLEELERERTLLNTNYDSLEQDYQVLQKEVEELHKQLTVARNTQPTPTMLPTPEISVHSSMSSESTHEERNDLKQNTNSSESSINEGEDMRSLRERLIKVEREKNEMKLKQRALNAPAEKKLRLTEEELRIANGKVASLRQELRRVQASKYVMDSTVCEMNTKTPGARNQPKIEYDYNTGSGVVLELQVLDLKNRVYHIEKENKEQDFKIQILEQDKDHYKKKAEEWKLNCLKEKKIMQKVRKELELKENEIQQYHTVLEDKGSLLEQRQFELGYQREKIEKLEREKNEKLEREKIESERQPRLPSATQHNPGNILPSSPKKDGDQTDAGSQEISSRGDAQQLGIHNNTRTRVERLPGARQTAQDLDKVPMWQSMDKENKDYSKYYLPRQSNKGLEDENCKTQ